MIICDSCLTKKDRVTVVKIEYPLGCIIEVYCDDCLKIIEDYETMAIIENGEIKSR